jgi:hypothetical protein
MAFSRKKCQPASSIRVDVNPTSSHKRHRFLLLMVAALITLGVVHTIFENTPPHYLGKDKISPQSVKNMKFAVRTESLGTALDEYPGIWPPLYPTVLHGAARIGISPPRTNEIIFCLILFWCYRFFLKRFGGPSAFASVALLALAGHQYANLRQITAEPLFLLLALVAYQQILAYTSQASSVRVIRLALVCAALFLTRYMGLIWVLPIALLCILAGRIAPRTRALHCALLLAISLLPTLGWMTYQHAETGFWTGMDRTAPRRFPAKLTHGKDLKRPQTHAHIALKTLTLDLLVPGAVAFHRNVQDPLPKGALGRAIQIAALGFLLYWLWLSADRLRAERPKKRTRTVLQETLFLPSGLAALFFVGFVVGTIALWSVTNNDPIYTRFLYPSYPFLLIAAAGSLARISRDCRARRFPFYFAYAVVLGVQLVDTASRSGWL